MSEAGEARGWVEVYTGSTPEVGMLEELLRQQGVRALVLPVDPMTALEGSVAWPARMQRLCVVEEDYQSHREAIEEALAVMSAPPEWEEEPEP